MKELWQDASRVKKYTDEDLLAFIRLLYEDVNAGKKEGEKRPLFHRDFYRAHKEKRRFNGRIIPDHSVICQRLFGMDNACRRAGVPYVAGRQPQSC